MTDPIRLNLGAGADRRDGYTHIDFRDDVGAEIVGDATDLSGFADGSVTEILALDFAEHHPPSKVPAMFAEWYRVLCSGGILVLRVPNLRVLGAQLARGVNVDKTIENIMGGHRWGPDGAWDCHHHGWVPATLARDLHAAGFIKVQIDARANMNSTAVKP